MLCVTDHQVSIEHTIIPAHLEQMLNILVDEETNNDTGTTGPCMEYLLQRRILETLYTLARTDVSHILLSAIKSVLKMYIHFTYGLTFIFLNFMCNKMN